MSATGARRIDVGRMLEERRVLRIGPMSGLWRARSALVCVVAALGALAIAILSLGVGDYALPPDAVLAGNNRAAFGAFRAIQRAGTSTALVGFDDFELAESLGVSVVSHSPQDMGRMAATLALRRIDTLDGALEQIVLPTQLVLRRSHLRFPHI